MAVYHAMKRLYASLAFLKTNSPPYNPPPSHVIVYPKLNGRLYIRDSNAKDIEVAGLPIIYNNTVYYNNQYVIPIFENNTVVNYVEIVLYYRTSDTIYRLETVLTFNPFLKVKEIEYVSDTGDHSYSWFFTFDSVNGTLTLTFNTPVDVPPGNLTIQAQVINKP